MDTPNLTGDSVSRNFGFYRFIYGNMVLLDGCPRIRAGDPPPARQYQRKPRNPHAMKLADRIQEFLQRLTPLTRSRLLIELERLELCGAGMPGAGTVLERLRAEFPNGGNPRNRAPDASGYFFAPLEPWLVDGAPEHANSGLISRGSLPAIWEWISRDLLPTMARDYVAGISELIAANHQREAKQAAATFQSKVAKSLENTLSTTEGAGQTRARLALYTASHAAYGDLAKMQCVLRARDGLARLDEALPASLAKFDDARRGAEVTGLLDAFRETEATALPFALALVARRLKTCWQLIHLATGAAAGKNATDLAATPYAITVSMVLDRLDDRRSALTAALKNNRVMVARDLLIDIYDIEQALRARIHELDESDWGVRLDALMNAIASLVESEVSRFPDEIGHVLGSRRLRGGLSWAGRLAPLRAAVHGGARFCRNLVGAA